jgi:WD40 repeat protein
MKTRCSIELLESALAGTLPADAESSLHQHLEECEKCGAALERMAGGPAWCQEAAVLLTKDELDAALPAREEWSAVDFTVEHLEPSDEPNVLGRLGGYDVLEIIGHGGMGVVLKAFDRELKRCVAIKVLAPHLAQSSLAKKRFAREAQAAAAVVHPHVLAIHQVQPSGRLPFLVMPLVAGESLAQRLAAQGPLELKEILRIGMQAAAGLAAAHEQGLVHRDVKPANILLEKGVERAVLTDFGLARAADDVTLTRWGVIAGTPQYMSPEQAQGEPLDGRSDLFSLGCVLYEMATGVSPFRTESVMATMRRLVEESPRALASLNPELPPWFVAIVERLLEKDPTCRFNSAKEVSELLEGCLAHVQQPASVPLPPALPAQAPRRAWLPPTIYIKGVLAMTAAFGICMLGFFLLSAGPPDIAGEWSGEDWGRVVLKKTNDAEYSGSFSETVGKQPGEIQLKWSPIERRFYGTWREGEDRFGELSLRLAGNEIRGALSTDAKSKINPATPRLADLTWIRADATQGLGVKSIELVALAKFPSAGSDWWTPDGRILNEPPVDPRESDILSYVDPKETWYTALFRVPDGFDSVVGHDIVQGVAVRWVWAGRQFRNSRPVDDLWALGIALPVDAKQTDLTVQVACGKWRTIATVDGKRLREKETASESNTDWQVVDRVGRIRLFVDYPQGNVQARVISRRGGQFTYASPLYTASPNSGKARIEVQFPELDMYLDNSFILQTRPFEKVEFRNVVLRSDSKKPAVDAASEATFGPVIERTVNDDRVNKDWMIDLDTGVLHTPPAVVDKQLTSEQMLEWARQNGIDASGVKSSQGVLQGVELQTVVLDGASWDSVTPELLKSALKGQESGDAVKNEKGPGATIGGGGRPQTALYGFQTREGGTGVLQIVGITEKPAAVRIRYKLVRQPGQVRGTGGWGEPVEGVSVRLRAEKVVWRTDEAPLLSADVRNEGTRPFNTSVNSRLWRLEVDGFWYLGNVDGGSGVEFDATHPLNNLPVLMEPSWRTAHENEFSGAQYGGGGTWIPDNFKRQPLTLHPGKHIVRLAIFALPTRSGGPTVVRAVSNPVEIEIVSAPIAREATSAENKEGKTSADSSARDGKKESEQEKAIAEIKKLGGKVAIDEKSPDKPVVEVNLSYGPVTDAGLAYLKGLPQLQSLNLEECGKITDAGLANVKGLTRLKMLNLRRTNITDAGMVNLKGLTQLDVLMLESISEGRDVTDAGLANLKGLTQLTALILVNAKITDAGLADLKGLTRLYILNLEECTKITDAGLTNLKGMTKLHWLKLDGTAVTKDGVKDLKRSLPDCIINNGGPPMPLRDSIRLVPSEESIRLGPSEATFGPVIERTIPSFHAIDFLSGRVSEWPAEWRNTTSTGEIKEEQRWIVDAGIAAWAVDGELIGSGTLAAPCPVAFDAATPAQAMAAVAGLTLERDGLRPTKKGYPVTQFFLTREAAIGILQINGMSGEEPRSVKIRYKLVQKPGQARGPGGTTTVNWLPRRIFRLNTKNRVTALAYSPDGKKLAFGGDPETISLFDANSGKAIAALKLFSKEEEDILPAAGQPMRNVEVRALAFSPDSSVLAVGNSIGQVKLFNAQTGAIILSLNDVVRKADGEKDLPKLLELRLAQGNVWAIAFSPDGSLLATCGDAIYYNQDDATRQGLGPSAGLLKLWDAKTGVLKQDLKGEFNRQVLDVAFSPDGKFLASTGHWSTGSGVKLWDPQTGKVAKVMESPGGNSGGGSALCFSFSPDGKRMAMGMMQYDKSTNITSGAIVVVYPASGIIDLRWLAPRVRPIAFSPDGKLIAAFSAKSKLTLWDSTTGLPKCGIPPAAQSDGEEWECFAFAPQGKMLAIGGIDAEKRGFVEVWNLDGASAEGY